MPNVHDSATGEIRTFAENQPVCFTLDEDPETRKYYGLVFSNGENLPYVKSGAVTYGAASLFNLKPHVKP
jgi:hypothetical protein